MNKVKPVDNLKSLTVKYDNLMIKSQRLYEVYDSVGLKYLLEKVQDIDEVYTTLVDSNNLIQDSNKMAFFFINFFKDFEEKLIYNTQIQNSEVLKICKEIHKEYS